MIEYELYNDEKTMHLRLIGRNNLVDFQDSMPIITKELKNGNFKNLIIEIVNLQHGFDYVDPDLAFYSINEMKRWIAKVALVCNGEIPSEVDALMELFRNYQIPVVSFANMSDARDWFQKVK